MTATQSLNTFGYRGDSLIADTATIRNAFQEVIDLMDYQVKWIVALFIPLYLSIVGLIITLLIRR